MNNLKELKLTEEKNVHLSFEDYAAIREPAVNIIVNDYAAKLVDADREANGDAATLTLDEAREIARKEIPAAFVPEWMKNLRISANIAGTELIYLEALHGTLGRIEELLSVVFAERIEKHLTELAESFRGECEVAADDE